MNKANIYDGVALMYTSLACETEILANALCSEVLMSN